MRDSHYSPFLLPETPEFLELLWAPTPEPPLRLCSGDLTAPPDPQLARAMTLPCRHDIIINPTFRVYRISFLNDSAFYLNVGLLGAASIKRRRFVSKIKTEENEILCHFRAKRYFLNHFEWMKSAINSSSFYTLIQSSIEKLPIILHL